MDHYVSPLLQVPAPNEVYKYDRVDLELDGVDHSGDSFAVRVFINEPEADFQTPAHPENASYAGSFYIFGHGPCLGDEGHCDVPPGPIQPYDFRPPHQLTPQYHRLPITAALRASAHEDTFAVTLVVVANRDGSYQSADLLAFRRLSVVAYS
jgi:hypothetical protein